MVGLVEVVMITVTPAFVPRITLESTVRTVSTIELQCCF